MLKTFAKPISKWRDFIGREIHVTAVQQIFLTHAGARDLRKKKKQKERKRAWKEERAWVRGCAGVSQSRTQSLRSF